MTQIVEVIENVDKKPILLRDIKPGMIFQIKDRLDVSWKPSEIYLCTDVSELNGTVVCVNLFSINGCPKYSFHIFGKYDIRVFKKITFSESTQYVES